MLATVLEESMRSSESRKEWPVCGLAWSGGRLPWEVPECPALTASKESGTQRRLGV